MSKKGEMNRRKPRKVETRDPVDRYYIFCEGIETEPNYIDGFRRAIQSNSSIYKNAVYLYCKGTGRETINIVNEARQYVSRNEITLGNVWCLYDKDDFPDDQFDAASKLIDELNDSGESVTYHAGWSNESIEYWFVLHFSNYTVNNTRKEFIDYLNREFRKKLNKPYEKNDVEIWDKLLKIGNPKNAIKYAEKQMSSFSGCKDSQCAPATKVFLLVKELARYLPDDIKKQFIDV